MECKIKSPTFTSRGALYIFKNCVRLNRRCKGNAITDLDKKFPPTLSRFNNFHYLCTIFKNCVLMKVLDYSLRLQCRPSRVHPDTCRVQIIIRLSSSGKRYSVTIPAVFKTDEVKKFDTLTHPLDTSDFDYSTWRKMREWAWDVSSAMQDLMKNPNRICKSEIDKRVKYYVDQRKKGLREWTIGDMYADIRNAQEGVSK